MTDERGSTYLETLIALPVIFAVFVTLMMFGRLAVGHLVAQRAASAGARAAVVILPDDPDYYGGRMASKQDCVHEAVRRVLRVYPFFDIDRVKVEITGGQSEWAPTTVTVSAPFDCRAFIGSNSFFSRQLCGSTRIATFETRSTLAYQAGPIEQQ
jgi:Flp pilus assembly protein TadG